LFLQGLPEKNSEKSAVSSPGSTATSRNPCRELQLFSCSADRLLSETISPHSAGEYLHRTLGQIRLFAAFMPLTELLSSLAIGLILWYGGTQIIGRNLTIGELVAFLAYMRLFFQPLRELSQKYSIVQSALASAERIFNMLDKEQQIKEPSVPASLGRPEGRLVFDHLTFGYEEEKPVLHDLSMTIEPGQTVAIVGTTGSGKTTLISLLMRFYEAQQGNDFNRWHKYQQTEIKGITHNDRRHSPGCLHPTGHAAGKYRHGQRLFPRVRNGCARTDRDVPLPRPAAGRP
jgi:ABC-type multidrug transport system fused ATPase/permease subunit